jgi:hypothetical protein
MGDPVETFRRFAFLIGKWVIFASIAVACAAAAGIGLIRGYSWYTHDRHVDKVEVTASIDKKECESEDYPILVLVGNGSTNTVERVEFTLSAREKGRSTNLAKHHVYVEDAILPPSHGRSSCVRAPLRDTWPLISQSAKS